MSKEKIINQTRLDAVVNWISQKFSKIGHKHTKADITDFTHTHTKSQITDFPAIPDVTVSSGDSGKNYIIKVSTSAPASGTANNIITFVTE